MAVMMVERMAVKMVVNLDYEWGATTEEMQVFWLVGLKVFWLVAL